LDLYPWTFGFGRLSTCRVLLSGSYPYASAILQGLMAQCAVLLGTYSYYLQASVQMRERGVRRFLSFFVVPSFSFLFPILLFGFEGHVVSHLGLKIRHWLWSLCSTTKNQEIDSQNLFRHCGLGMAKSASISKLLTVYLIRKSHNHDHL
jgi:hypothetical protein